MKAAILYKYDQTPQYGEQETPQPRSDQELLQVKAAPLKNFDRLTTNAKFYARIKDLPAAVGSDGVGLTPDGKRVYASGMTGMMAEQALIHKSKKVTIPENLDWATAAALPNAVMGTVLPLQIKGKIKTGDVVVIHGATGFTGQIATQATRHFGAKSIIVTGRDEERLERLKSLGATETLSLKNPNWSSQMEELQKETQVDIVLDYIWGEPAETLLTILSKGPTHSTRYIDLGNNAGESITMTAGLIRNSALEILGAGVGSYTPDEFGQLFTELIPEMYNLAAQGKLEVPIQKAPLDSIESVWETPSEAGIRTVFTLF